MPIKILQLALFCKNTLNSSSFKTPISTVCLKRPFTHYSKIASPLNSKIPLTSSIIISEGAAKQIRFLQERDNNPKEALKVILESGGCHGFKILFDLTDELSSDDVLFEREGAKVIVNKAFIPLLEGATVDFSQELIGSTFKIINNPNAASGCGCGISFELK